MKVENPFDQKRGYQFGIEVSGEIRPLHDSVIVTDMTFEGRQLQSGVILLGDDGKADGIRPRWAQVYAIGPEQHDVVPGRLNFLRHSMGQTQVSQSRYQGLLVKLPKSTTAI